MVVLNGGVVEVKQREAKGEDEVKSCCKIFTYLPY